MGLDDLFQVAGTDRLPPVESWNPPYCGDIGLRIDGNGQWFYRDSPIGRERLVGLFARVLRRDDDGAYYLVTPGEKISIRVEDAPFVAVEMQVSGDARAQKILFRTNVGDVVCCGVNNPLHFQTEGAHRGTKPYVRVRGRLDALVARALTYDLLELVVAGEGGALGIWSDGVFFQLPP